MYVGRNSVLLTSSYISDGPFPLVSPVPGLFPKLCSTMSSISHPPWVQPCPWPPIVDSPTKPCHINSHGYFFHVSPLPPALHRLTWSSAWTTAVVSCWLQFLRGQTWAVSFYIYSAVEHLLFRLLPRHYFPPGRFLVFSPVLLNVLTSILVLVRGHPLGLFSFYLPPP